MHGEEKLMYQIEQVRAEMSKIALEKGPTHQDTLAISEELDRLLNKYDRKCNTF